MADALNMINGSPVTDLPSGQPVNTPSGFIPAAGQKTAASGQKPDSSAAGTTPPTAVIFDRPPTPWPVVLKGFNFEQLSTYLTAYELGVYRFIVRIWDLMRRRDEHLLSVSAKRMKRVSRLDYEISANDSTPEAVAQAEFLADFIAGIRFKKSGDAQEYFGLRKAFRHLMTAHGNGYAGCEIQWLPAAGIGKRSIGPAAGANAAGETAAENYEYYEALRCDLIKIRSDFFDESNGVMRLFANAVSSQAMDVPEDKLIVHRADDALMIAGSILFVMKQIALGQWNDFDDRFGLPGLIGTAPDGASQTSRDEMLKLLTNWSSKLAAMLPPGYAATFANAAAGMSGGIPAAVMVERCEDAMSVLWLGGNLSTKSKSGTGTLAGGAQSEDQLELTQDDAEELAETITNQLCAPAVKFQFGQPLMCEFRFKIAQEVDLAAEIGVVVELVKELGLKISEADVRKKFGWRKPEANEEIITPPAQPAGQVAKAPSPPSISRELSGDGGTALKANSRLPVAGGQNSESGNVADDADAIAARHSASGRAALQTMIDQIRTVVGQDLTTAELEKRLKGLQSTLPSNAFQKVIEAVLEESFSAGASDVMRHTQAAAAGGGA